MAQKRRKNRRELIDEIIDKQAFEGIDYENELSSRELIEKSAMERHRYNINKYCILIKYNGVTLKDIPIKYRNEKEIVLAATEKFNGAQKPLLFDYSDLIFDASEEILKDKDIINEILKHDHTIEKYIQRFQNIKNNKEFILSAIKKNKKFIFQIGNELKDDKEFIIEAINLLPFLKIVYSDDLDEELIDEVSPIVNLLSPRLKTDIDIISVIIDKTYEYYRIASICMLINMASSIYDKNRIFIWALEKGYYNVIYCIGVEEILNNREVVIAAVNIYGTLLEYTNDEIKNNREIVLASVRNNFHAIEYASLILREDNEIIQEAVSNFIKNIDWVSTCNCGQDNDNFLNIFNNNFFVCLNYVNRDGYYLRFVSEELINNKEIVLEAVKNDGMALAYASNELKNDRDIVLFAVKNDGKALRYANDELKNDRDIVLAAMDNNCFAYQYASENLREDDEILQKLLFDIIHDKRDILRYDLSNDGALHDVLCTNFFACLNYVNKYGSNLHYASDELKNNKEIVLEAIKSNYEALQYASNELKNDREFVLTAVRRDYRILQYAGNEFKSDRESMLATINIYGSALEYASDELKNDREVVLAAVRNDGYALVFASDELKNDRVIVLIAVKNYGDALQYASDELKNDREVVLEAVKNGYCALRYANDELKNDSEILYEAIPKLIEETKFYYILEGYSEKYVSLLNGLNNNFLVFLNLVSHNGALLRFASEELINNKELVLEAMKNNILAFHFASYNLKNDKDVVLAAVRKDGFLLKYASDELKNNREIVIEAMKNNIFAFHFASNELKCDFKLALFATKKNYRLLKMVNELEYNENTSEQFLKEPEFLIECLSLKKCHINSNDDSNLKYDEIRKQAIKNLLNKIQKKLKKRSKEL